MVSRDCIHTPLQYNCSACGIYISPEQGVQAVRSDTIACLEITDLSRYQKSLLKQISRFQPKRIGLPPSPVLTLIQSLITKFKMSRQTYALTIFLFTCVAGRKKMTSMRQQLFAGACIMLACKFADKQFNVPTISQMNTVLGVEDSYKDQLKIIEKEVFEALSYDLRLSTFVDLLELYLFNGVVFSSQIHPDEGVIQTYILQEADAYLKSGRFMRYKQSQLAGWIVFKARKLFGLKEVWNSHLQIITGVKTDSIQQIVREFEMEEEGIFVRQSIVNVRYGHIQSTEKKSEAECTLRKMLLKEQPIIKIQASKYRLHSIKSYEKLNISSFRVE